jgi:hypothetical protein
MACIKQKQLKNSSTHEDLIYNLFYYKDKNCNGTTIFKKIINSKNSESLNGYLYEALIRVLFIMKCFVNLSCDELYDGKISEHINKTTLKNISKEKIHQGGNGVDIIIKKDDTYIGFSVKYKKTFDARKTDCEIINTEFKKSGLKYKVGFITRDKDFVINHKYLSEQEDYCIVMKQIMQNNLLFDKNDVISSLDNFIDMYKDIKMITLNGMKIKKLIEYIDEKIYNVKRKCLIQRLHQNLTLNKFIQNYDSRYHLVPHVPRSGKSITLLLMAKYMMNEKKMKRILLFTAVPSTITSFINVLDTFYDFNGIDYKKQGDEVPKDWTGVYFCSIQYLKISKKTDKNEKINFLKTMKFAALISDEAHIGSSTNKSRTNIINVDTDFDDIQKNISKVVFASGTPGKTKKYYGIRSKNVYEWDYIDNNLMKQQKYDFMSKRHGSIFKECLKKKNIDKDYTKYPIQILERYKINNYFVKQINRYNEKNGTTYGFDFNSLFELVQVVEKDKIKYLPKFKLCETEDGKDIMAGILNKLVNENSMQRKESIMYTIEQLQSRYNSRKSSFENPKLFIIYLPTNSQFSNIEPLQKALYTFLIENELWSKYNIEYTNSKSNSLGHKCKDYDKFINTIMSNTRKHKKKGCILFLGDQGTTGVTYHDCDVTISLDNGKSLDNEKQKQARAMTDAPGKTIGINIDMNIQRCFSMVVDKCNTFRKITKENMNNTEIMKYMYLNKLFVFDSSKIANFGSCHESVIIDHYKKIANEISQNLDDDIYLEDLECEDMLNEFILENDFTKSYLDSRVKEEKEYTQKEIDELYNGLNEDMPTPETEKILAIIEEKKGQKEKIEEVVEEEITLLVNKTLEVMKTWLMPFIIIMSIKNKYSNVALMLDDIEIMSKIINVMNEKKIEFELTKDNIVLIKEAMKSIIESNSDIVNNIREIYENVEPRQYRKMIEKHFIPTMEEKKQNAEVPTPVKLVDEMLDKIPSEFWMKQQKVFEPCCGKGNFVLGIFYKLYDGLVELYPNEYERCKVIIEECLYYADISTLNVFITTEILKCEVQSRCGEEDFNDWKFNTYVGDTLKLDIQDKWNNTGFDAVIGNPPYEAQKATGDNKLYLEFISYSLKSLYKNALLLLLVPTNIKNYITNQDKNRSYINNFMEIMYLSLNTSNKYFPNISTYFSYFLIKKNIVKSCKTKTAFMRGKKIENSFITINEKDELPLTLSTKDINLINKVSNLIKKQWDTLDIKKALYKKHNKLCTQRIRKTHIKNGDIKEKYDEIYKYKIIDKINKGHNFPGIYYYNNYKMIDYGKPKIIMCSGGYLMPSLDKDGIYNISDNMLYMLINNISEYEGLTILINSRLIKYLNKVTMTDNIHGRDLVIKNIKNITLNNIKCEGDIYSQLNITNDELELIKNTIN